MSYSQPGPATNTPTRAYVLLQALGRHHNEVIKTLKRQEGVVAADLVEGPPDIVLVLEASDRQQLASVLINALTSVQNMTEGLELLPTRSRNLKKATETAEGNDL